MSTRQSHDKGLRAVARVREVREQTSLRQLQGSLAEQREREARLAHLTDQLTAAARIDADLLGAGAPGALIGLRSTLESLGVSIGAAKEAVAEATAVATRDRRAWEHDKSRLRAVEQLLDRRAEARATEADRVVAREQDDLAAQGWLRRATTPSTAEEAR